MKQYAIGLDFGTLSVRAILIDIHTGEEVGHSVYEYPHAVMETHLPYGAELPSGWALQDPQDYLIGMITTVGDVVEQADALPEEVVGIGIDFTSSTVLPVTKEAMPLCFMPEFANEPHAYVKLWKHHGAEEEAAEIDRVAHERDERWINSYGGKVSSEWMIPKILETLRRAPQVYDAADRFMEALDWIVWELTGEETRSACLLGYKAFYNDKTGFPSREFFAAVDPKLENLIEEKMDAPILPIGSTAGYLTEEAAQILGLAPGTPVGTGIIDAHASVPGGGISKPGEMMIIMGTSSCHLFLSDRELDIPGIAGYVKDGIMPGSYGYEAGQSCVGDHFAWVVKNLVPPSYEREARARGIGLHELLALKLKDYRAGQSGLIALDWFNGVRSPLMDFNLSGMILGMNLLTRPEEIYMALIEATAFGTRVIIDQFEDSGVPVETVVLSGGIPMKNPMIVQVYADVLGKELRLAGSAQTCALGAAILGIAAAPEEVTGYRNANEVAARLGSMQDVVIRPNPENVRAYEKLYEEYKLLLEYFGKGRNDVMKRLAALRDEVRGRC